MATECPLMVCFTHEGKAKMIYCGLWSCKRCRARLAKEHARRVRHGVNRLVETGGRPLFWTFTLPPKYRRAKEGYSVLKRLWDSLSKAIRREQGTFQFAAFVEGQEKRGDMPHFHVVTFATVPRKWHKRKDPRKWIKDFAAHYGFGYQAEERLINSAQASAYVSKYVSKSTPNIPKNFRRVRYSQKWPKMPESAKKPYIVRSMGEPIQDYLLRVEQASNVDVETLLRDYQTTNTKMLIERLTQECTD